MPKRVGNLMPRIASLENLHEAFLRAAKGKSAKKTVIDFRRNLDRNLTEMRQSLLDGTFRFGHYHYFTVFDPKQRTICAASFPERVASHAMMRICHPVFDDFQTDGSFASRKGRGQYAALERTRQYAGRYPWFAKLDMCKYFDSIDHGVMLGQLARLFKDRQLMMYFRDLIDGYEVSEGCGLPIGNLTSQYFANHYLAVADHYAKEQLHVKAMVRYMDDILFFADDRQTLMRQVELYSDYVQEALRLKVHPPVMNRAQTGIPFLGYVVRADRLRLNGRSLLRFKHKMARLHRDLSEGTLSDNEYANRATCLFAFIEKADVRGLKQKLSITPGMYPQGL